MTEKRGKDERNWKENDSDGGQRWSDGRIIAIPLVVTSIPKRNPYITISL